MSPIKKMVKKGHLYHIYYRRSGGYRFLGGNIYKLILSLIIFGAIIWAFNRFVFDISEATNFIFENFNRTIIFLSLFISEIGLGLLPPDLYIAWAKEFNHPWLTVGFLAVISYVGGIISYYIGTRLYHLPKIHQWVDEKFKTQFDQIRKYGGLLISIAALTPLPFSPVSVVAGVVNFPFKTYLFVALTRFVRFFLYAWVIFSFLK